LALIVVLRRSHAMPRVFSARNAYSSLSTFSLLSAGYILAAAAAAAAAAAGDSLTFPAKERAMSTIDRNIEAFCSTRIQQMTPLQTHFGLRNRLEQA
jgi:hypothetical protein